MASENRPAIPKELERKLLIEAGHRCAIHTCRHTDVTIHHIVPWSKVREHQYENMIALCPNCHKKADRGQIDRKSLFTYKANLQRLINGAAQAFNNNGMSAWKNETIEESLLEEPGFDIKIEFPFFSKEFSSSMDEVNNLVKSTIYDNLHGLRKLHAERLRTQEKGIVDFGGSYEVTLLNKKMLSVRFSFYQYIPFAAHPLHFTVPINCRLQPVIPLEIGDLFKDKSVWLNQLSNITIQRLINGLEDDLWQTNEDWIHSGAGPIAENFTCFNLTPDFLSITFGEYQIGPYSQGSTTVNIPYHELNGFIHWDSQDYQLIGSST